VRARRVGCFPIYQRATAALLLTRKEFDDNINNNDDNGHGQNTALTISAPPGGPPPAMPPGILFLGSLPPDGDWLGHFTPPGGSRLS